MATPDKSTVMENQPGPIFPLLVQQSIQQPAPPVQKFSCHWGNCGAVFNNLEEIEAHIIAAHITKTPPYICHWAKCRRNGHDFGQFYLYVNHIRTHTARDLHACSVAGCARRYRSIDNLRNHMITHALPKPIPCSIVGCYRTFNNVVERGKHVSRAHSNKRFMCPMLECRKRYSDPSSLRKHLKGLHGESAYAVFRELKNTVRLWEKNFRVRTNVDGNARVVGVNGEEINFEEIINHVPEITEAEMLHHQNVGDLDDEGGFSDESSDVTHNYDVKHPPFCYPYGPPPPFYQMPPMFVYPMPGQHGVQDRPAGSSSKPSTPTEQQSPAGQMFTHMSFPPFMPQQPGPSGSQKPSSPPTPAGPYARDSRPSNH
uniref:C2H2-type domain-containing protein n=1 Tax=Panagrolaimus sp. JU765 TaxID=591449 RepID=A0AC34QMK8_9BILA